MTGNAAPALRVFIFGITGRVGRLLSMRLRARGVLVAGLVREASQADVLRAEGILSAVGDLAAVTAVDVAGLIAGYDVVVYAAGSNAGPRDVTDAIDVEALRRVSDAIEEHPRTRLLLLSVLPEAWRERTLSDDEEHYFAAKKTAEVDLTRREVEWTILRPSLLTDASGRGAVSFGPAEEHGEITRADVAAVLEALVFEPSVRRRILELNEGSTPIPVAIDALRPARATLR